MCVCVGVCVGPNLADGAEAPVLLNKVMLLQRKSEMKQTESKANEEQRHTKTSSRGRHEANKAAVKMSLPTNNTPPCARTGADLCFNGPGSARISRDEAGGRKEKQREGRGASCNSQQIFTVHHTHDTHNSHTTVQESIPSKHK